MLYMFMVTLVSLTHTSHFKWIIYAARWSFLGIFHPAQSPFWHREHPYVVPTLIWACTDFPRATVHWLGGFPVVHSCKLPSAHVGVLYISECTSSLSVACTWDNSLKQVLKDTLFMPPMWTRPVLTPLSESFASVYLPWDALSGLPAQRGPKVAGRDKFP